MPTYTKREAALDHARIQARNTGIRWAIWYVDGMWHAGTPALAPGNCRQFSIVSPIDGEPINTSVKTPDMDLRDWFAGLVIQGSYPSQISDVDLAEGAYTLADAMMERRKR